MKIGDIIEIEGEKYIAQDENKKGYPGCFGCAFDNMRCGEITEKIECMEDEIIFVKIPLELIKKNRTTGKTN